MSDFNSENPSKKLKSDEFEKDARMYEYGYAANPTLPPVPVLAFPSKLHETGPTQIIPFDLSTQMGFTYPATSPNLLAAFLRICKGESLTTETKATSQAFYVIRGSGSSVCDKIVVEWKEGDLFLFPTILASVVHGATEDASLYWVNDSPLLTYLGVKPTVSKYQTTVFKKERMLAEVERIRHEPGAEHRNRLGILLGNKITEDSTKTLTHVLWSLLNMLPPNEAQRPHRHNSVALDLCVYAPPSGVYTLMGPEMTADGWVKDPIRMDWAPGAVFVTPPGWWHSHHNETGEPAWVLPMQDAGLYTYQRTLDIQFSKPPDTVTPTPPPKGGLGY